MSEDCIAGNHLDPTNPFGWIEVRLNLPGSLEYDPSKPWVYWLCSETGCLTSFYGVYIDNIGTRGATEADFRDVTCQVASLVNYLGQQDTLQKRRAPSRTPGAWAGAMCRSLAKDGLYVTCLQEKWTKGKQKVMAWYDLVVEQGHTELNYKDLERDVGFLVILNQTFPMIFPYLKGLNECLETRLRSRWLEVEPS